MEVLLRRTLQGFAPTNDTEADKCRRYKLGSIVRVEMAQMRNYKFLQKFMVMLQIAFDAWSDSAKTQDYKGQPVEPSMERFRKDVTILAGYYTPVWNIREELRLEAKSISFGRMSQEEFEDLYSRVIDVLLQKVIPERGYSEEKLRQLVDQVVGFS